MTMLAYSIGSPVGQRLQCENLLMLPIAILALLHGAMFTAGTVYGELLMLAMLASLGSLRLAASPNTSQLADDLQVLAIAALVTIAMLYVLA
ncbi:hypothetical protein P1P91_01085 [Halomonas piscis]|uniref:Uncharacterized protein n=2 Tax=Halomonas TaxID=2745 RepID=A0ABY9Z220_9GAMM|nr:hypothetical protein [Halomonas piscis]WNK20314.1 hypothetical protein P1P91_01085 [Halomonas piscis]